MGHPIPNNTGQPQQYYDAQGRPIDMKSYYEYYGVKTDERGVPLPGQIMGGPVGTLQTGPIPGQQQQQQVQQQQIQPAPVQVSNQTQQVAGGYAPAPNNGSAPVQPVGVSTQPTGVVPSGIPSDMNHNGSVSSKNLNTTNRYFHTLPPLHPHEVELRVPIAELGGEL